LLVATHPLSVGTLDGNNGFRIDGVNEAQSPMLVTLMAMALTI